MTSKFSSFVARTAAMAVLSVAIPAAVQAAEIEKVGTVAGWDIVIDTTMNFGCAAQAEYQDGSVVRVGLDPANKEGYVLILDEAVKGFKAGTAYTVDMDLDNQSWEANADAVNFHGSPALFISFDDPAFFRDIMRKYAMKVSYKGKEITSFSLEGTARALEAVVACQEGVNQAR